MKTKMMKIYWAKLALRITVFLTVLGIYIYDKNILMTLLLQPVYMGVNLMHLLWLGFMYMMLSHLKPKEPFTMACLKGMGSKFDPVENYDRIKLFEYTKQQNVAAWKVMLVWLAGNGIVGILHTVEIIGDAELIMLSVFYFLCDYICILFYCPFQSHIMKNKCCVNCRIYDWGHFMMFTPMLFIHSFYSLSLFFTSAVVLIHWELIYAKYPERFYSGSNKRLQCANCKDKTCQMKNNIKSNFKK